ncbi:MAG: acyltransferase family protein [Ilumatobacteraceae bacterium]
MLRPVHQPSVPGDQQFGYQPALDGLRGVAVTLVLFFHGGFAWMAGGYVGVSVFFTLSGFLITSLLILEHQRSGRVSWTAFVARRAKRLLPASLLCLVAISLLAWNGEFAGVPHLRRDVTTAALQVANWNALHGSGSYADLLSRAAGLSSPVDHYWSLAVEEQFYWVWPFAFMLLMKVSKGRGRLFVNLSALAVIGIVAARVIAVHWGPDAAYWATPARLGEILVGAALAAGCLLWRRRPRWLGVLGVAGLGVVVWTAVEWPTRGGPAYAGWFGLFSLASAALILGLQAPGPLRAVFSLSPIVWLGRISYGVYVFHWPVYVLATSRTVHLRGWPLFGVRIAITLTVALLSYWLLERPVRRGRYGARLSLTLGLPITAAVVLLAALVVPGSPVRRHVAAASPTTTTVPVVAPGSTVAGADVTVEPAASSVLPTTAPVPVGPVNMVLIGDSTAEALSAGVDAWAAETSDRTVVSVATAGCGLITGTVLLGDDGGRFAKRCATALQKELPATLAANRPDTAMIMVTIPDLTMRQWSGDEGMLRPDDARYAARMLDDYRATADMLIAAGVRHIAWVVPPVPGQWWVGWMSDTVYTATTWVQLNAVLTTVETEYPDVVQVVHLDQWFTERGLDVDEALRDDGLHLTAEGALMVMDDFLGPVLLRLAVV